MTPPIPDPRATAVAEQIHSGHTGDCDLWHNQGQHVQCTCDVQGRIESTARLISAALADAKREVWNEAITLAERFTCKGERTVPDSCGTAICQASRVLIDALHAKATEARHE